MHSVSWIVHGALFNVSTPNKDTAEHLVAILPRWMRPRLWYNARKEAVLIQPIR